MSKKGLGKGLSALIPKGKMDLKEVPVNDILPSPLQSREYFSKESLEELALSIKEEGIIEPLIVREKGGKFEIIAGERRWRAAKIAGLEKVPVIVKEADDEETLQISLIENLQREELNPLEKAKGYKILIERFHFTHEDIAKRLGKSRSSITNTLRLLNLPEEIKKEILEGRITEGHARILVSLPPGEREKVKKEILQRSLTVRETEKRARRKKKRPYYLPPYIEDLQRKLGTKVYSVGGESKGKIVIEYYSLEDLERILETLGVSID